MEVFNLTDIAEVKEVTERGYNPLFLPQFSFDINVRIEFQRLIFGHSILSRGDIPKANERFYRMVWDFKPHHCEECMKPLKNYSSVWISHILSRGSSPEIAHDPRNINILCAAHHSQWETGERKTMRIYPRNMKTISVLQLEYNESKKEYEKSRK